jgi:site-specific DNA-methyltransferase (adenine-specific)
MQSWHYAWAVEAYRVLKPGGHLLAFGGTRTYHRLVCALEDAGFEIRDTVAWLYGQGFPKSLNVSKAIDKAAGVTRGKVARVRVDGRSGSSLNHTVEGYSGIGLDAGLTSGPPATPDAAVWEGWGTALKPAFEPIVVARKPLSERTVAANVLRWGTGALNIDACRIEGIPPSVPQPDFSQVAGRSTRLDASARNGEMSQSSGRWPANVALDEEAAALLDEQTGKLTSGDGNTRRKVHETNAMAGTLGMLDREEVSYGDTGGASRFFYVAKAGKKERNRGLAEGEKNDHPTVKPVALLRWLCRLVTAPGGRILDPFAGSGSAGVAALQEHFEYVGIEKEPAYSAIAVARLRAAEDSVSDAKRQEE